MTLLHELWFLRINVVRQHLEQLQISSSPEVQIKVSLLERICTLGPDVAKGCQSKKMIVPVKIKGSCQNKVICTYAMLDTGSTASFCTEDILKKLGISGTRCKMSLATVNNEEQHKCVMVNLDVMDLDKNVMIEVPNAFSVKKLNVSLESITKQKDVDNWPYLHGITVPRALTNQDVGLLIGVDVSEALEPVEVSVGTLFQTLAEILFLTLIKKHSEEKGEFCKILRLITSYTRLESCHANTKGKLTKHLTA
eukprot:gene9979-biopygen12668